MTELFGEVNIKHPNRLSAELRNGKVTLDGTEIKLVWYANSETGVVKTYDVSGDGQIYLSRNSIVSSREVEDVDGVWSMTLRGKVRMFAPAEENQDL